MRLAYVSGAIGLLLSTAPTTALDAHLTFSLDLHADAQRLLTRYECDGMEPFTVEYLNADPLFLALMPIAGDKRLFVNVLSASGARYASGQYEWWSKGSEATLTDLAAPPASTPIACLEISETP